MAVVGMIAGVGGAALLFYCVNVFIEGMPQRLSEGVIPYIFVLPSFALLGLVLVYPTLQTINYSFANQDSTAYVGSTTTWRSSAAASSGSRSPTTRCG